MQDFFLARQPILNRQHELVAFELLFRSSPYNQAFVPNGALATSQVVLNAFGEMGMADVLGAYQGYVNIEESFLFSEMLEILPRKRVVLELLESVEITPELVARCRELRGSGYRLALDDVTEITDAMLPLLEVVEVVKLDVPHLGWEQMGKMVGRLRDFPVKLLAEKVERPEQAELCEAMGFELFQGYHFAHPELLAGKRVHPARLALLEILTLMMNGAELEEVEEAFKAHPEMVYNLMRLVNSAALGLQRKIGSLRHAMAMLGRRPLQRWVQLLLYTTEGGGGISPLMQLAATRGKMLELLTLRLRPHDLNYADRAFMVGVLSLVGVVLALPLSEVLSRLRVHEEVEAALLQKRGMLGWLLELCELLEQDATTAIAEWMRRHPGLDINAINQVELEALAWANSIAF